MTSGGSVPDVCQSTTTYDGRVHACTDGEVTLTLNLCSGWYVISPLQVALIQMLTSDAELVWLNPSPAISASTISDYILATQQRCILVAELVD